MQPEGAGGLSACALGLAPFFAPLYQCLDGYCNAEAAELLVAPSFSLLPNRI